MKDVVFRGESHPQDGGEYERSYRASIQNVDDSKLSTCEPEDCCFEISVHVF